MARCSLGPKQSGAAVAHLPEGALSGCVPSDLDSFEGYDWDTLRQATGQVLDLAGRLGIWVVVGSEHRLSDGNKPHNSLYVIDDAGRLVDRYDKRFCVGDPEELTEELAHYSPGDHGSVWEINGVHCGCAHSATSTASPSSIVSTRTTGVQLLFHSFNAAHASPERVTAIGSGIGTELASLNPAPMFTYPVTMRRDDDGCGGVQPPLDQLPALLGAREPLAVVPQTGRRRPAKTDSVDCVRDPHFAPASGGKMSRRSDHFQASHRHGSRGPCASLDGEGLLQHRRRG